MTQTELSQVFNEFAAQSQKDHPQLNDELLVLDSDNGTFHGSFSRKKKYTFISNEDFAASLKRAADDIAQYGSHANKISFTMNGVPGVRAGSLIAYSHERDSQRLMGGDHPELYAMMFTLYHELGHHVVKDSMYTGETDEGRNFSETAADIYALIRMRQKFPDEQPGLFEAYVSVGRIISLAEWGHTSHYTNFAIDKLREVSRTVDLQALTPQQSAELAWNIAAQNTVPAPVQFRIKEDFRAFRDEVTKDRPTAMQNLAEKVLAADNTFFRAGMHYFTPLFIGIAAIPDVDFSTDWWKDMGKKLLTRARDIAIDGVGAGLPKLQQPPNIQNITP